MLISELCVALQKYDINMSASVIRRLASDGVISSPPRYPKEEGKGRGGPSNWPERSIGEIVAFWVLTHDPVYGTTPKFTISWMRQDWYSLIKNAATMLKLWLIGDSVMPVGSAPLHLTVSLGDESGLSYACRPTFARWIATVQKVQDQRPIDEPIWLRYWWVVSKNQYGNVIAIFEPSPIVEKTRPEDPEDHVFLNFSRHGRSQNLSDEKEAQHD
jgi:hypothetical protein